MDKGSFRCDANVSLRLRGAETLGAKVEVKNMNSFRAVQRAIETEIERQTAILSSGGTIEQETRGYIDATGTTVSQRSKEEAHDYRYFPEPDLPPLDTTPDIVEALRARLPELPDARRRRFEAEYGLTASEAALLTESRSEADAYEETVRLAQGGGAQAGSAGDGHARAVAHWFIGDLARLLHPEGGAVELSTTLLTPAHIAELVALVEGGTITLTTAKEVLEIAFETGAQPAAIVEERGLGQVRDEGEIDRIAREVIEANPKPVADFQGGKAAALQFLVGQVMRQTRGRADANSAAEVLRRHLDGS